MRSQSSPETAWFCCTSTAIMVSSGGNVLVNNSVVRERDILEFELHGKLLKINIKCALLSIERPDPLDSTIYPSYSSVATFVPSVFLSVIHRDQRRSTIIGGDESFKLECIENSSI